MDKNFIEGLMALVEKSGIVELEFSEGNQRIRIVQRQVGAPTLSHHQPHTVELPDDPATQTGARKLNQVTAGMTGLFYRSPSPGAEPFVSVGDKVEEGQPLALLEAMKMLTPVEAQLAGHIASIDAQDGATVERGALLFTIEPGEP